MRATLVTSPAALTERSHGHDHGHDQGHDDGHDHGHDHACGHTAGPAGGAHAHGDEGDSSDDDHAHGHAARGGAGGPKQSVAMQAALAHVIGDLIQSLGVVLAAGLIWGLHDRWPDARGLSHWYRADPVCTLFSALLVLLSTWATIKVRRKQRARRAAWRQTRGARLTAPARATRDIRSAGGGRPSARVARSRDA